MLSNLLTPYIETDTLFYMAAEQKAKTATGLMQPGILVERQIREAIGLKMLKIDPFDLKSLEPATYDLRVGSTAVVSTLSEPVDLRERPLLTIEPYASAFLQTDEILQLSPRMVGRLGPRSNLSRHGIFVSTGPQIDPGFHGRLFVNLLNVTDRPFLIRYQTRFLTVEFHLLAAAPDQIYKGPNQDKMELSEDDINRILGRGGPSLKDVHRDLLEMLQLMKGVATLGEEVPRLAELQESALNRIVDLNRVAQTPSIIVPISTLAPTPYTLIRDIPCLVQPADSGFVATFFDANISASGDTQQEALENLKALLVDIYDDLVSEPDEKLGPEPKRQLEVLKTLIRKRP